MMAIAPVSQAVNDFRFSTFTNEANDEATNYLGLIAKDDATNHLFLNSEPLSNADWKSLPDWLGYQYLTMNITAGNHRVFSGSSFALFNIFAYSHFEKDAYGISGFEQAMSKDLKDLIYI